MNIPLEKAIIRSICAAVTRSGGMAIKLHGGAMQRGGLPDLLIVQQRPEGQCRVFFLEVKRPGGKLTMRQGAMLDDLRARKANAAVVYSIKEAREVLGLP